MKNAKKVLAFMLTLSMAVSVLSVNTFAANDALTVVADSVTAEPGAVVEVKVNITKNPGVVAFGLSIEYNENVLTLNSVTDKGVFGTNGATVNQQPADDSCDCYVLFEKALSKQDITATGELLTLSFTVAEGASNGDYGIDFTVSDATNTALSAVAGVAEDGKITVTTQGADPDLPSVEEDVDISKMPETLPKENISFAKVDGNALMTIDPVSISGGETVTAPACVVLIKNGESYTKVNATANTDGTYSFDVSGLGDGEIVVATKGDANGDGTVDGTDITAIARSLLQSGNNRYAALDELKSLIGDANGDGTIDGTDSTAIARSLLQSSNNRYAATTW